MKGTGQFSVSILRKRLLAMTLGFIFLFFILFVQFFLIQIVRSKTLGFKALDQWTRELPVVAERGVIRDKNGVVLAGNLPTYSVYIRRNALVDREGVATTLSNLFSLDKDELLEKMKKNVSEFAVVKGIDKEQACKLDEYALQGVYYAPDQVRVYPYENLLCQVLGFTSSDHHGVSGLEKYYDDYLKGESGEICYETDLVGVDVNDHVLYKDATKGIDLTLTVDYRIQTLVERVIGEVYLSTKAKNAQCLVLDLDSFGVLAMASCPSYDLNDVPREDASLLTSLSRNGLISNSYEPGSTFKVVTAAANLQEYLNGNQNAFSPNYIFPASRTRLVDGTTVKCWSDHTNGKHSHQTLAEALNNSCNPCFTDMALSLGSEVFYDYLYKFGFGKTTGIDFPGEALGMLLPSVSVRNCDLARIGFGQSVAVTALQLACAVGSAVNGGNYYVPHLVSKIGEITVKKELKSHPIGEEASALLRGMLEGVVRDGSGKKAYIDGVRIGGKTGTAQKYENGRIASGKYVSSFIGFYPADCPKKLVLVIIDEPQGAYYGSVVAAPCARDVFQGMIALEEDL